MILAFWLKLDADGSVFRQDFSSGTHIQRLYRNIETFPIDVKTIQEIYEANGEPIPTATNLPLDGIAAHKIIMMMLRKGFVTIRFQDSSNTVHINTWERTKHVDDALFSWSKCYAAKFRDNTKVILNQFHMNTKQPLTIRLKTLKGLQTMVGFLPLQEV